jgi:hypothetical protein
MKQVNDIIISITMYNVSAEQKGTHFRNDDDDLIYRFFRNNVGNFKVSIKLFYHIHFYIIHPKDGFVSTTHSQLLRVYRTRILIESVMA